jgi:hypothetical protein
MNNGRLKERQKGQTKRIALCPFLNKICFIEAKRTFLLPSAGRNKK